MPTMTGCPAPGTTTEDGYSCNPAHQYPPGELCVLIGDCYFLRGTGLLTSIIGGNGTATGTAPPYPTGTTADGCPAPGTTTEDGYSCNPAHQYPDGEECVLIDGCYFLRGTGLLTSGAPVPPIVTGTGAPMPTSTDHVISGAGLLKAASLTSVTGLLAVAVYAML
ncbi:hypothetical protein F5X68DRAFT_208257 [Plectosphaerella plurivora]|uniref:Uncharacterized protein n=1 Tax=Plectosphaerella plurivora TaxID=936078 RepID=A0A9P9ACG2_9PEZI|nr:hypothetical protein F5X68DRAFT_208257 [Plectosphaerella plurivora]